ncbi:MAG: Rrf2 family transcriptional regulator [Saprospiraceae bacterium]|jgi:Rrf2 family protein|nr:Rrf2 family transcriptional regulator [Saprospiraceae bacterium]
MLSLTCRAAIKAVIFLGSKFDSGEKFSIKEIADAIDENEHTVGKLLQKLVKESVVNSSKGPTGGFYITAEQSQQKVIRIVEAIDGKDIFKQCGLGLSKCSETRPCPFHNDYKPIRDLFETMYNNKLVYELYTNVNAGGAFLKG